MVIPTKKTKNGFEMPVYGLGTWGMGGKMSRDLGNDDDADIKAIREAIDSGVAHLDTAEVYAGGHSEILLGRAIEGYDRSNLFLVSKVQKDHLRYDDVIKAANDSLRRLKTGYLDLYLTHRFNPAGVSIMDTMRAMDTLVEMGMVRYIGVCNYTVEQIQEAQAYAKNKIVAAQLHFNLQYREAEKKGVLKYCQENDIIFIAWRPVQKGILVKNIPDILTKMALKYKKTPGQIAINWLISQDGVVTLSKTGNSEHLKENLGGIGWEMKDADIEILRKEFPGQKEISDSVPLGT